MEAAYNNPPEAKSENAAPPQLSTRQLVDREFEAQSTRRRFSNPELHLALYGLYEAGLIAKFRDEEGVERFQPTEKSLAD